MTYFLIDENNVITNVIECDDPTVAEELGAVPENPELGIGDTYEPYVPPDPEPEPTPDYATKDDVQAVWDTLAAAYQKGVDEA